MINRRPFWRRRFIVDWKLQGSLCAHGLLYGGLVLVAVSSGIFVPLLWSLSGSTVGVGLEDQAIVMLYMHDRFWSLAFLCFVIIVLGAIKFSHRIAGPLVRYKRNLRLIARGKLPTPLRTRANDYLKEEVACLNEAVAGITLRLDAIHAAQVAVQREIEAAVARTPRQSLAQLEPLLAAGRDLERSLAAFERFDPRDDHLPEATAPVRVPIGLVVSNAGS